VALDSNATAEEFRYEGSIECPAPGNGCCYRSIDLSARLVATDLVPDSTSALAGSVLVGFLIDGLLQFLTANRWAASKSVRMGQRFHYWVQLDRGTAV